MKAQTAAETERDDANTARDTAITARDAAMTARDTAIMERDAALAMVTTETEDAVAAQRARDGRGCDPGRSADDHVTTTVNCVQAGNCRRG